ncbi:D-aspartate oxidase isoform X2 [Colossoma macropomum]|nr:D-aspartate oxidase isoform X2 [Colossoma macropomum]XP_036448672.1 D-aspartate oxidase isoform X2 [Colossoma macropomum]XP_036448673.1 D-aspartate oxidase isoform X2 [Colossoma macropomum]XP_036448674.1 D-aspartate oxidase isoform X2 [Colossoma macropomum]XP_036448675.1 D-aspartate oxidase isoform X2 [Colossoma macropomum]XP_036448676.1 D-aspartate oxidase isoform X2 [Colossoma macropomum]XP_036448677.1 D-aspartate oxidase isoform X2 [Colossoma macropomum]XP_036448678.1 D-aspartate oxida
MNTVKVAVVGAGVIGLSTAVCLAEALPYCSVNILAEKFSPDTTSDGAAGILMPKVFPDIPVERQRRWFKQTFDHLLSIVESPEAPEAGVYLSSGYHIFKEVPTDPNPYWTDFVFGFRTMTVHEMKRFPKHTFGQAFTTIKCECSRYLPWLEKRFRKAGGQIKCEKVTDLQQLISHYDVIVNCSGLGSHHLVGDEKVYPVRGQILKVHATWLKNFIRDGDGNTYIYPGIDHVTLGGTRQKDDWRLEVDKGDSKGIMERCSQLEPSLQKAQVLEEWVGLRPGRRNLRVEKEWLQAQDRQVLLVHNYGHGGCGISLSWGSALDTVGLVRKSLHEKPLRAKL